MTSIILNANEKAVDNESERFPKISPTIYITEPIVKLSGFKVGSITFVGLQKVDNKFLEREVAIAKDDFINFEQIENIKKNLKNLNLFSKVEIQVKENGESKDLIIQLEEKWTRIPIFKYSKGGGVQQTTIGLYDPNIEGQYYEAGFQFEFIEKNLSGVLWYKNPRFLQTKDNLDFQYWNIRRLRIKYDPMEDSPVEVQGFIQKREKIYIAYEPFFSSKLRGRFLLENNKDNFNREALTSEQKILFANKPLPSDQAVGLLGVGLDFGELDWDGFLVDGQKLSANLKQAFVYKEMNKNFLQFDLNWIFAKTLNGKNTFAQRLLTGTTSTTLLQYWNYLGGLDRIRGFQDNRFAGRYYILSNSEYRMASFMRPSYILQSVVFLDLLSISEKFSDLNKLNAASTGLGVRLILPKVYRLNFRMDFSQTIKKKDDQFLSFGLQQFF